MFPVWQSWMGAGKSSVATLRLLSGQWTNPKVFNRVHSRTCLLSGVTQHQITLLSDGDQCALPNCPGSLGYNDSVRQVRSRNRWIATEWITVPHQLPERGLQRKWDNGNKNAKNVHYDIRLFPINQFNITICHCYNIHGTTTPVEHSYSSFVDKVSDILRKKNRKV